MDLTKDGKLTKLTATQIKNKVQEILDPTIAVSNSFYNRFISYANSRSARRTKEIYLVTAKKMYVTSISSMRTLLEEKVKTCKPVFCYILKCS